MACCCWGSEKHFCGCRGGRCGIFERHNSVRGQQVGTNRRDSTHPGLGTDVQGVDGDVAAVTYHLSYVLVFSLRTRGIEYTRQSRGKTWRYIVEGV